MAKIAHWNDTSFVPKQQNLCNNPPKVDADLQTRIRSLLVSRNGHHPPRTPCPSPDFANLPYESDEDLPSYSSIRARSHTFTVVKAIAKLTVLESKDFGLSIRKSVVPNDQMMDIDSDEFRKSSSQPWSKKDNNPKTDNVNDKDLPNLEDLAISSQVSQQHQTSENPSTAILSKSRGQLRPQISVSRIPVNSLRSVPSTGSHSNKMPKRPGRQHIPGSFVSETDSNIPQNSAVAPSTINDDVVNSFLQSSSVQRHPKSKLEVQSPAIESLVKAQDHDHSQTILSPRNLLKREPSQTSLRSNTSALYSRYLSPKLGSGRSNVGKVAEPVTTSNVVQGHFYCESLGPLQFMPTESHNVGSTKSSSTQPGIVETRHTKETGIHQALSESSNHPELFDLALKDPAMHQVLEQHHDHSVPAILHETEFVPLINRHHTGRMTLSSDVNDDSPDKIDMSNFNPENDVNQNSPTTIARKLSSFGKAMTGLSDGSFLPNLQMPFSRTSISTVKDDTMCSTCGNQESRSSLYHNKSEHLNDTPDQARLIKNSITSESEPKKHWIHQMLAKTSSSSLLQNHSNLTARPSRRTSYSTNATSGLRSEKPGAENEHKKKDSLMESSFEDEKNLMDQQQTSPEPVTRMIQDLEGLLKEALVIARQATDSEVHELDPARETYDINHGASYPNDAELDYSSDDSSNVSDSSSLRSEERDLQEDRITVVEPYSRFQDTKQSLQAWDIKSCPVSSISVIRKRSAVSIPSDKNITLKSVHVPNMDEGMATKPGRISGPTLQPVAKDIANDSESLTEAPYPKDISRSIKTNDWALVEKSSPILKSQILMSKTFKFPRKPDNLQNPSKEQHEFVIRKHRPSSVTTARTTIHQHAKPQGPHIQPRSSSAHLRLSNPHVVNYQFPKLPVSDEGYDDVPMAILHPSEPQRRTETQHTTGNRTNRGYSFSPSLDRPYEAELSSLPEHGNGVHEARPQYQGGSLKRHFSLTGRRHLSFRESHGFSLSRSHRRSPIARDWRTPRKRYVATVACISTALMGLIIGIYAGEVPAIQYAIVDEHHYTILGNVVFFIGMAITTALFWPLPLLHGRKSYTIAALALLLPLQFPQALAVNQQRSPDIVTHRVGLLLSRSLSGLVMGFANINFKTTLLDLFGASLQSAHPHQETVSNNDVRRHGGGMGVWLGIWVWCSIGSIGVGFLIGAVLISGLDVVWGFWLTIILIAFTLILNVLVPEVRRSHHRRSMAEIQQGDGVSRRIARGEIKMHLDMTGPKWWWEEVVAGHRLCLRMLKQPGFTILSTYMGWIYGQIVMVIVLLGALTSKHYRFHPQYVGLCVAAVPLGALLAIPFQKASLFSRSRKEAPRTDSMTVRDKITWTSHLIRRGFFMITLPFAGLAYTLASGGSHTHFMIPTFFAGLIGFLSNLALAECHGIIMETYDTSDLQAGMTGRPRRVLPEEVRNKMNNFSCFPRVSAAFAIAQSSAFFIAAAATGCGGAIERRVGAQTATAFVAAVLLVLTLLLMGVLWRFKVVQIIPSQRFGTNVLTGPEDEWKPIIIGNPSGTTRRMSLLELGKQSRWSEIRRRNKLAPEE